MTTPLYRIKNWKELFENNRSREIKRLEWVCMPNRHDGGKYAELMDHKQGPEHFAGWILMVQVASRCGVAGERNGELRRGDGSPHTFRSLALATKCPERIFRDAIPRLLDLKWIEIVEIEENSNSTAQGCGIVAPSPHIVTTLGKGREQDISGRDSNACARVDEENPQERAARVLELYPSKAKKDGRPITKTLEALNLLTLKIKLHPDYPWEQHANLCRFEPTPVNAVKWANSMPDEIAFASLMKTFPGHGGGNASKSVEEKRKATENKEKEARERSDREWEAMSDEQKREYMDSTKKYLPDFERQQGGIN